MARAATLVRSGELVSLDLPVTLPSPPLFGRQPYEHHVFALSRNEMDDRLDNFHDRLDNRFGHFNNSRFDLSNRRLLSACHDNYLAS